MARSASARNKIEKNLNAAFNTGNLKRICQAMDAAIQQCGGVTGIALAAEVDRGTLYRGLRLRRGLALRNMMKVLAALGFELVVEVDQNVGRDVASKGRLAGGVVARRFTSALKNDDMSALNEVFRETLLAQKNVSQFAAKTNRTRESLYRVFNLYPMPRFSTLLSFLTAAGLRFGVRHLREPATRLQSETL